jgi:hypothetical protein
MAAGWHVWLVHQCHPEVESEEAYQPAPTASGGVMTPAFCVPCHG